MATDNLPPTLAVACSALASQLGPTQEARLLGELQAISDLIGQARTRGFLTPDILENTQARGGITVGAEKVCPSCLRPF